MITILVLQLDGGDVDQAIDDGIDGEACGRMNLQLAGDVAAMGDDGIYRDVETVGDFLVLQALNNTNDDVAFAVGQCLAIVLSAFEYH